MATLGLPAMSLGKLVVYLSANIKGLTSGLRTARQTTGQTVNTMSDLATSLNDAQSKLADLVPAYERLRDANGQFAASGSVPVANAEALQISLGSVINTIERLQKQTDSWATRVESQMALSDELSGHWDHVHGSVERGTLAMKKMTAQAKATASATQTIVVDTVSNKVRESNAPKPVSNLGMVRLAGMAIAANLASRAMVATNAVLKTSSTSMVKIGESTRHTIGYMDRFRAGLAAPVADQSMNVVKNGLDKVGDGLSSVVKKATAMADAVASDIPGAFGKVATNSAKVSRELDTTSLVMSKHISKAQSMSRGMTLLKVASFGLATNGINKLKGPLDTTIAGAEKAADAVDTMNAGLNLAANKARNAEFVLSGTFQKLGGSADRFAKANFHAVLPARLLYREIEGATRVIRAATHVWNFVTAPISKTVIALRHAREQYKVFRGELPKLTGGLQLGVRAYRAFAHGTYFASAAVKPFTATLGYAGGKLWGLVRPAKAAQVGLDGVATGGHKAGIVLRGLQGVAGTTATALRKVSSVGGGGIGSGITRGAGMAKLAVAGLMGAIVAMGTSTALATEKNNAVFGTMLHDMGQGAAVVKSIQGTEAAKLFDNNELLLSGRLLFKAGVNTVDLANRTNQFAKIATATSTELGDLTRIYQQGANAGSFGQDKINQYAERGIAIYEGLSVATGKSGAALKDMISKGQIGVVEMDAALAHLTEGHGIYADSLASMANTTAGKMATMKNNVSQSLGQVMGVALDVLSPFMTATVAITEGIKSSFDSFREPVMYAATAVAWFFKNLLGLAEFAFVAMALKAVSAFNDISYWLTDVMPAYLVWFADNWNSIFNDIVNATSAIFSNMYTNVASAMTEIWDFITSGGTDAMEFAWTPLLDGFKATVEALPQIAERPMGELEQSLQSHMESLGSTLADDFDASFAQAVATTAASQPNVDIKPATTSGLGEIDAATNEGVAAIEKAKAAENKASLVRSTEGQQAVADAIRGALGRDDKKEEKVLAKRSVTALEQIRRNTEGPKIRQAEFAPG
jgi:hypothetical protein